MATQTLLSVIFRISTEKYGMNEIKTGDLFTFWENGVRPDRPDKYPLIYVKTSSSSCVDIQTNSGVTTNINRLVDHFSEKFEQNRKVFKVFVDYTNSTTL